MTLMALKPHNPQPQNISPGYLCWLCSPSLLEWHFSEGNRSWNSGLLGLEQVSLVLGVLLRGLVGRCKFSGFRIGSLALVLMVVAAAAVGVAVKRARVE